MQDPAASVTFGAQKAVFRTTLRILVFRTRTSSVGSASNFSCPVSVDNWSES